MQLRRTIGWVGSVAFGLAITSVGGLIFSLAWDSSTIEQQLDTRGVYATATIAGKLERPVKRGVKSGQPMIRPDYFITYRFTADDGTAYSSEVNVSPNFYLSTEVGGSTPVRYLPDNPKRSEIEAGHSTARNYSGLLFGGLLSLIGVAATGIALFKPLVDSARARRKSQPSPP